MTGVLRVVDALPLLQDIDGATLKWWGFTISHGQLRLLALNIPRGLAEVTIIGANYLNMPLVMHNIHFDMASEVEAEVLRKDVLPSQAQSLHHEDCLIINCDEGKFSVWTGNINIHWLTFPDFGFLEAIEAELQLANLPLMNYFTSSLESHT